MTVKWYGDDILKQIRDATPDGLFEGAEMLAKEAASRAPRDEGDLQESAYAATSEKSTHQNKKTNRKQPPVKKGQAITGFADFKAGWHEFGTAKKAARPFLRPTFDELKSQLGNAIVLRIRRDVK